MHAVAVVEGTLLHHGTLDATSAVRARRTSPATRRRRVSLISRSVSAATRAGGGMPPHELQPWNAPQQQPLAVIRKAGDDEEERDDSWDSLPFKGVGGPLSFEWMAAIAGVRVLKRPRRNRPRVDFGKFQKI